MKTIVSIIIGCEELVSPIFSKLPALPKKSRQVITTYLPFVILFVGLVSLLQAALSIIFKISRLILTTPELLTPDIINITFTNLIIGTILIYSFRLLKHRSVTGWRYIFGLSILAGISNLIYNQFGLLQSGLFFYILFQIRENYHS